MSELLDAGDQIVIGAVERLMHEGDAWEGSFADLLDDLGEACGWGDEPPPSFWLDYSGRPPAGAVLGQRLRRCIPKLARGGVLVAIHHRAGKPVIEISRREEQR